MSANIADRNLLFGVLAWQNHIIDKQQLLDAMQAWTTNTSTPLDEILIDKGALSCKQHELLDTIVEAQLKLHQGSLHQSLRSISVIGPAVDDLPSLGAETAQTLVGNLLDTHILHSHGGQADGVAVTSEKARFSIIRPHARGGLGEVFLAFDEQLNREVALKEIQADHAFHQESQSRFVREAEITGRLEHPGIVPIYALGAYPDGRPYYAMRLIRGRSLAKAIDEYHASKTPAADKNMQFRELLKRFVAVCDAIAYAHSRGVLHRDLKPDNIMLGKFGETLVVDWGLAKPLGSELGESDYTEPESLLPTTATGDSETIAGSAVGTPAYMSPEQATGKDTQLGPGADVYSMGATLYHILAGQPSQTSQRELVETLKMVSEGRFRPPSEHNPSTPKALEAICLKAMAREPSGRYPKVSALAADVNRWLADEPVSAWREPVMVRCRRWLARHQTLAATVSTVVLAVLIGLTVFSGVMAGQKQQLASKNSALKETQRRLNIKNAELGGANQELIAAKEAAQLEADTANAVSAFLRGILEETDPVALSGRYFGARSVGKERSIREIVQAGTKQLDLPDEQVAFRDKPEVRARLLHLLGNVWISFGDGDVARRLLEESQELRRKHLPARHPDQVASLHVMGRLEISQGNWEGASESFREAMDLCDSILKENPSNRSLATMKADIAFDYAVMCAQSSAHPDGRLAIPLMEESLRIRKELFGPESREACLSLLGVGMICHRYDQLAKASAALAKAVPLLDKLRGGNSFERAATQLAWGTAYDNLNQGIAAEKAYRESLRIGMEALETEEHLLLVYVRRQLAQSLYSTQNEYELAQKEWETLLKQYQRLFGPENTAVAEAHTNLARCWRELKDYKTAKEHGRMAADIYIDYATLDVDGFTVCLDVWRHVLALNKNREIDVDRVLVGPAWIEFEEAMDETLEVLPPRAPIPIGRSEKVLRLANRYKTELKQQREQLTSSALRELGELLRLPPSQRAPLLDLRARELVKRDRLLEAEEAVLQLSKQENLSAHQLYNAACVFCRCAESLDPENDPSKKRPHELLLDAAVSALQDSIATGWDDKERLQADPQLKPLHARPEFKSLVQDLADRVVAP